VWPDATIDLIVVGKVVIKAKVVDRGLRKVTLTASLTILEESDLVADSSLATVGPEVVLIDAEIAVAGTIIISTEGTVELAEVAANGVTCGFEGDPTKGVVDPAGSSRLVVRPLVERVASNCSILLAISEIGHVAVKVVASAAATRAVEVTVVNHTAAIVLSNALDGHSGHVALNVAPVPVDTAVVVISSLVDATNSRQDLTKASIAATIEDVAHVVRAKTVLTLTTIALGLNGEGDEALGVVIESRAVNKTTVRILGGEIATLAEVVVVLATVARIAVAVAPAIQANNVALTSARKVDVTDARAE